MSGTALYLAIDQGGHASRAMVFDQVARIISQAEAPIRTLTPQTDRVEHDAYDVINATKLAIATALDALGADKHRVKAAGLATQRSSIACWDRSSGQPLAPILSWQDRRQAQWLERLQTRNALIHQKTGLFLSPHYGASKMRWCLDNIAAVAEARDRNELVIGPLASLLAFQLTREQVLVADPANASRTLLWNISSNDWDDELLALFGIDRHILPPCAHSYGNFGQLDIDGLNIPLIVITGDQSAALFAWGKPDPETRYINIGTGAFIQRPMQTLRLHARLLASMAYRDDAYRCYTLEGTVNGAARALQWYADMNHIEALEQRVQACLDLDAMPPLFINTVSGLGSPDWLARLEPRFIGAADIDAQLLAVLESIVFLIQRNLDVMADDCHKPARIVVSGGLSSLDGLCQRIADLAQTPVLRPAEHEASARGLAYLMAGRPTVWLDDYAAGKTFTAESNTGLNQRFIDWSEALNRLIDAAGKTQP